MAHKSFIVLGKYDGKIEACSHPYSTLTQAKTVAADLSTKDPGNVYYVATIEMKVTCPPSQPVFEYFS